jgi:cytidylate kinase
VTPRVVAIDGAAGSGKSTLARRMAHALGLPYINTGLMYRAVAASALRDGVDPDDVHRLMEITRHLRFRLAGEPPSLMVEGWDEQELTTAEVEVTVSSVARHEPVRGILRAAQRDLGADGAVMEGRDIATVVFPDAPVKLFLRAAPGTREARRAAERDLAASQVARAVVGRDAQDARTNPLTPAPDAVVLDTEDLDVDQTVAAALRVVRERAPDLMP